MSDEKRKCIFTNKPSNAKLQVASDKYSWAKSVPCTKEFLKKKGSRQLNELEFKLVELFYEKEMVRLRIEHLDAQMTEIRANMQCSNPEKPREIVLTQKKMPLKKFINDTPFVHVKEFTKKEEEELEQELEQEQVRGPLKHLEDLQGIQSYNEEDTEDVQLTEEKKDAKVDKEADLWD